MSDPVRSFLYVVGPRCDLISATMHMWGRMHGNVGIEFVPGDFGSANDVVVYLQKCGIQCGALIGGSGPEYHKTNVPKNKHKFALAMLKKAGVPAW